MKEYFNLEHKGKDLDDAVGTVREFCKVKQLEYVGSFAKKAGGERIDDVVRVGGQYYKAQVSSRYVHQGSSISFAEFHLYRGFDLDEHWPLEECRVMIDVWDVRVDDERPLCRYAFKEEIDARKVVSPDLDFDVWIDGKEVDREEFLK